MASRLRARLLTTLGLALVSSIMVAGISLAGFLEPIQLKASDFLFKTRPERNEQRIIIVGIDDRTLAELSGYGRLLAWPRSFHARVIRALREAGARVIALDILFDVPAPGDDELRDAIREAGSVISPVAGLAAGRAGAPGGPLTYDDLLHPLASLLEVSADVGHANQSPDSDGTVRRVPLEIVVRGEPVPSLSLAAVSRYLRRRDALEGQLQDSFLPFAGRRIPVDGSVRMRVNFLGPPASQPRSDVIPVVSYLDVLQGTFPQELVRDRIVFVGIMAAAMADDYWVPTARRDKMDGVEVHAHAAATILSAAFVEEMSWGATVGLVLLFSLLVGLLLLASSPIWGTIGTLVLVVLYVVAGSVLFETRNLVVDFVYPIMGTAMAFASLMVYRVLFEQREQRAIRTIFAQYVPPAVVQEIVRSPEAIKLGGERRTITVLFTDLRGFTNFSESVEPEVLSAVISEYLNAMTRVVFKYDGTVDKYIGDAVMAFWNAPQSQPQHARLACLAALEMQGELARLSDQWQRRGLPRQQMRIGINTGPVSVGNMGSSLRLAYTAIGDAVNLGARLEGLNNEYGTGICISEYTRAGAGDGLATRYLDLVAVKGKARPVAVYELLGLDSQLSPVVEKVLERYEKGIELYKARRFDEAAEHFRAALEADPHDGPSAVYLGRCVEMGENPPPAEWDGVYVMKHK